MLFRCSLNFKLLRCLALLLVLGTTTALNAEQVTGFQSALFGMAPDDAKKSFVADNIAVTSSEQAEGNDLIYAQRNMGWLTTELLYVFPSTSQRLALVIEVFPGLLNAGPVGEELVKKLGKPDSDNYPESVLKHMQDSGVIPAGVKQLSVWNQEEKGIDREVRLMELEGHIRVEYIDNMLMSQQ